MPRDGLAVAKNERCSTQPERPFALIRRQPPRASPSCTRVFGPMDAMTLAVRLAPARTTTQFRETVFTHTTRVRDLDVDLAGAFATALAGVFTAAFDGGAFFVASFVAGFLRGATGARASVRAEVPAGAAVSERSTERGDPRTGAS